MTILPIDQAHSISFACFRARFISVICPKITTIRFVVIKSSALKRVIYCNLKSKYKSNESIKKRGKDKKGNVEKIKKPDIIISKFISVTTEPILMKQLKTNPEEILFYKTPHWNQFIRLRATMPQTDRHTLAPII